MWLEIRRRDHVVSTRNKLIHFRNIVGFVSAHFWLDPKFWTGSVSSSDLSVSKQIKHLGKVLISTDNEHVHTYAMHFKKMY